MFREEDAYLAVDGDVENREAAARKIMQTRDSERERAENGKSKGRKNSKRRSIDLRAGLRRLGTGGDRAGRAASRCWGGESQLRREKQIGEKESGGESGQNE